MKHTDPFWTKFEILTQLFASSEGALAFVHLSMIISHSRLQQLQPLFLLGFFCAPHWCQSLYEVELFYRQLMISQVIEDKRIQQIRILTNNSLFIDMICKVHIFWEGHKILQNLHLTFEFWLALHTTKVRWRFHKILWASQNIWTLPENVFVLICRTGKTNYAWQLVQNM